MSTDGIRLFMLFKLMRLKTNLWRYDKNGKTVSSNSHVKTQPFACTYKDITVPPSSAKTGLVW